MRNISETAPGNRAHVELQGGCPHSPNVDACDPPGVGPTGALAGPPRRVLLPVQPAELEETRDAVLSSVRAVRRSSTRLVFGRVLS